MPPHTTCEGDRSHFTNLIIFSHLGYLGSDPVLDQVQPFWVTLALKPTGGHQPTKTSLENGPFWDTKARGGEGGER